MNFKVKVLGNIVALSVIMLLWQNCGKSNGFVGAPAPASSSIQGSESGDGEPEVEQPAPDVPDTVTPPPVEVVLPTSCDQAKPGDCLVRFSLGYYTSLAPSAKVHLAYPASSQKRIICTKADSNTCLADLRSTMIKYCGLREAYFFTTPNQVRDFYNSKKLLMVDLSILSPIFDEYISLQVSNKKTSVIHSGVNFLICYNK